MGTKWQGATYYTDIPQSLKASVLRTHKGVCHVCGQPGATQVDHIHPQAWGGTHDPANLAPIHPEPCHREKTQHEAREGRKLKPPPKQRRAAEPHPGLLR